MRVAKIQLEALSASFREPFVVAANQTSFSMPPPSTIYGLVSAAHGRRLDPAKFAFAYTFKHGGLVEDYEQQWPVILGKPLDMKPHAREFLFRPQLTLYLYPENFGDAFLRPMYPLTLGRSQDLAFVSSVRRVDIERSEKAFFANTLLPYSMRREHGLVSGVLQAMPQYIAPWPSRMPHFRKYICLHETAYSPGSPEVRPTQKLKPTKKPWWVDSDDYVDDGHRRGLVFHTCFLHVDLDPSNIFYDLA